MDQLTAINVVLLGSNQAPIVALSETNIGPPADALACLREVARVLLGDGTWGFNELTAGPRTSPVGADVISIYGNPGLALRGRRVYREDGTELDRDVVFSVRVVLPWDSLPVTFRSLVAAQGARWYNESFFGDSERIQHLAAEERRAFASARQADVRDEGSVTMLDNLAATAGAHRLATFRNPRFSRRFTFDI